MTYFPFTLWLYVVIYFLTVNINGDINGLLCSGIPFAHRLLPVQCLQWPSNARCFLRVRFELWELSQTKDLSSVIKFFTLIMLSFFTCFLYPEDHAASATFPYFLKCYCRGVVNLLKINFQEASLKMQKKTCILVCSGYHRKIPVRWFQQQPCMISEFWRLELPDWSPDGRALERICFLACLWPSSHHMLTWRKREERNFPFSS